MGIRAVENKEHDIRMTPFESSIIDMLCRFYEADASNPHPCFGYFAIFCCMISSALAS